MRLPCVYAVRAPCAGWEQDKLIRAVAEEERARVVAFLTDPRCALFSEAEYVQATPAQLSRLILEAGAAGIDGKRLLCLVHVCGIGMCAVHVRVCACTYVRVCWLSCFFPAFRFVSLVQLCPDVRKKKRKPGRPLHPALHCIALGMPTRLHAHSRDAEPARSQV